MTNNIDFPSLDDRLLRLGDEKPYSNFTWSHIADSLCKEYNVSHSESWFRKRYKKLRELCDKETERLIDYEESVISDDTLSYSIKKNIESDKSTQIKALIRRASREDSIKEIAHDFAMQMNEKKMLPFVYKEIGGENSAIIQLSDWHYGIEFSNYRNSYNTDTCEYRLGILLKKTVEIIKKHNVNELYVVNLSDLIAGRIHLTLRLQSRIDVITQTMRVSELMAEFLYELSKVVKVKYYDCSDNHSRIEPNKHDSLQLESLSRITHWYLAERLVDNQNITIYNNIVGDDIIKFDCLGHKILAVHGDNDKPTNIVQRMQSLLSESFDMMLLAHEHHFCANEDSGCIIIQNGSLMGTDDYAYNLRKYAKPSQNVIIVTKDSPAECIYRVVLDS